MMKEITISAIGIGEKNTNSNIPRAERPPKPEAIAGDAIAIRPGRPIKHKATISCFLTIVCPGLINVYIQKTNSAIIADPPVTLMDSGSIFRNQQKPGQIYFIG